MYDKIDSKFGLENYSRGNNARLVTIGDLDLYFSYKTVIAFNYEGRTIGRVNEWGPTTGRHMNDVPGNAKEDRLNGEDFRNALGELTEELNL